MKLKITAGAHGGICSLSVKRTTLEAALSSAGRKGEERESIASIIWLEQITSAKILVREKTPNQRIVPVSFVLLQLNLIIFSGLQAGVHLLR